MGRFHFCQLCKKDFECEYYLPGLGCRCESNENRGVEVCYDCWDSVPRPTGCFTCFKKFEFRNALFRHLKEKPEHMIDYPEKCPKCGKFSRRKFKPRELIDHVYSCFLFSDLIEKPQPDMTTCIRLGISYSISKNDIY